MTIFDLWNINKKSLHNSHSHPQFKEREIFHASLWINVWYEQNGKGSDFLRPVVIIRKFNNSVCWVVPLTKQNKKNMKYYYMFLFKDNMQSFAVLSQIRLIDSKRLVKKIWMIQKQDFFELNKKISQLLITEDL